MMSGPRSAMLLPLSLLLTLATPGSPAAPVPAPAPLPAVSRAALAGPTLPGDDLPRGVAALGKDSQLSFEDLDGVLLWRHGRGEQGRAALRQLIELRLVERMMAEQRLTISEKQLEKRWSELDAETRGQGIVGGLDQYLREERIDRDTFREYLELSIATEVLARRALGIRDRDPITSEQQQAWLEQEIQRRGYEEESFPWTGDTVARVGDVTLYLADYRNQLRQQLDHETLSQAAYEALLEQRLLQRFPALEPTAIDRAVDAELEIRRENAAKDPRYKGVAFEELLGAQGLSIEALRRDPAIRAKAIAQLTIDSRYGADDLRAIYTSERELFDGRFGEAVELYAIVLKAARYKNELATRSFEEAAAALERMKREIDSLADFKQVATLRSEEPQSRQVGGRLGVVARGEKNLPQHVVDEVFEVLERSGDESVSGRVLGPVQIQGACMLLALGERRPAPPWSVMRGHVRRELERRLYLETLQPGEVQLWQ